MPSVAPVAPRKKERRVKSMESEPCAVLRGHVEDCGSDSLDASYPIAESAATPSVAPVAPRRNERRVMSAVSQSGAMFLA